MSRHLPPLRFPDHPAGLHRVEQSSVAPLIPRPVSLPALGRSSPDSAQYFASARMDSSGRVQNRDAVQLLGWSPGDLLLVTVLGTSAVFQRRPDGVMAMTTKPYVVVPGPVRTRCHIPAGGRVLIAADPGQDVLVVHPPSAVDAMLRLFHTRLAGGDNQ